MAISRKDFEDDAFKAYRGSSLKVLDFLKENKDSAYTSKEISEALTPLSQVSVTIALRTLVNNGLVEAKKPYYILKSASSAKKKVVKAGEAEDVE